jgi:ribosomal protein L11 methylase PrmA
VYHQIGGFGILFQKPFRCAALLAALLLAAAAAAQDNQPAHPLDVPFVTTPDEGVQAMLKLANVKKTDVVYDLGCGDGRIVIAAARDFGARGVGIDIDPQRIAESKENARKAGVENLVRFEVNDIFDADIHEASVVTIFLLSSVNLRLRPKLLNDLKPGTRIVSNTWDMGDWKPEKEVTVNDAPVGCWKFSAPLTRSAWVCSNLSRKMLLWTIPPHPQH